MKRKHSYLQSKYVLTVFQKNIKNRVSTRKSEKRLFFYTLSSIKTKLLITGLSNICSYIWVICNKVSQIKCPYIYIYMNRCWISQETHEYIFRGAKNIWHLYHKKYFYTYSELLGLFLFKTHYMNSLWLIVLVLLMKECKKIAFFQIL